MLYPDLNSSSMTLLVQVGSSKTCELYSTLHNEAPRWGLTGENNEEITRNIMCCLNNKDFSLPERPLANNEPEELDSEWIHRPPSLEEVENDKTQSTTKEDTWMQNTETESTTSQSTPKEQQQQQQSSNKNPISGISQDDLQELLMFFEPLWFDRSYGWTGTDVTEAQEFCHKKAGNRSLCPYVAYCPAGPMGTVTEGRVSDRDIEWAPMREWNGLHWVGTGKNNSCMQAKDVSEFGLDEVEVGDASDDIMCCKDKGQELLDGD